MTTTSVPGIPYRSEQTHTLIGEMQPRRKKHRSIFEQINVCKKKKKKKQERKLNKSFQKRLFDFLFWLNVACIVKGLQVFGFLYLSASAAFLSPNFMVSDYSFLSQTMSQNPTRTAGSGKKKKVPLNFSCVSTVIGTRPFRCLILMSWFRSNITLGRNKVGVWMLLIIQDL